MSRESWPQNVGHNKNDRVEVTSRHSPLWEIYSPLGLLSRQKPHCREKCEGQLQEYVGDYDDWLAQRIVRSEPEKAMLREEKHKREKQPPVLSGIR